MVSTWQTTATGGGGGGGTGVGGGGGGTVGTRPVSTTESSSSTDTVNTVTSGSWHSTAGDGGLGTSATTAPPYATGTYYSRTDGNPQTLPIVASVTHSMPVSAAVTQNGVGGTISAVTWQSTAGQVTSYANAATGRDEFPPPTRIPDPARCPPLQFVANTFRDISDTMVGSAVTYICKVGHIFPDGGRYRSLVCLPSLEWSSVVDRGCTRTYFRLQV